VFVRNWRSHSHIDCRVFSASAKVRINRRPHSE
jgi:hypothetical protein